ncbi:hypothetical protein HanRHA438_Chr10g0458311 [Helianthus annuus]|nr:hypothetical protein HanRHA438_Chr10g0458311 [Helianthus annuus]
MQIQINTTLPEHILRPSATKTAAGANNRRRLIRPDVRRPGRPVDGVFERCGDGIVVFR